MTGSHEVRGSNPLRSIYLQVKLSARATLGQQPVLMLYVFGIQLPRAVLPDDSPSARCITAKPVHGEFLLMRQSAFGITHDNVPASDKVSTPLVGTPGS
jgi:hypothetical protein